MYNICMSPERNDTFFSEGGKGGQYCFQTNIYVGSWLVQYKYGHVTDNRGIEKEKGVMAITALFLNIQDKI